jgi:hypothetical protein
VIESGQGYGGASLGRGMRVVEYAARVKRGIAVLLVAGGWRLAAGCWSFEAFTGKNPLNKFWEYNDE